MYAALLAYEGVGPEPDDDDDGDGDGDELVSMPVEEYQRLVEQAQWNPERTYRRWAEGS